VDSHHIVFEVKLLVVPGGGTSGGLWSYLMLRAGTAVGSELRALSSWALKNSKDGACTTSLGILLRCWPALMVKCHSRAVLVVGRLSNAYRNKS